MDHLFARRTVTARPMNARVREPGEFCENGLELSVRRSSISRLDRRAYFYSERRRILCAILGYISNPDEAEREIGRAVDSDVELGCALFEMNGLSGIRRLRGVFLLLIHDGMTGRLHVAQGEYGHQLVLYHMWHEGRLVLSTSLKLLLRRVRFERRLDEEAAADWLAFRVIPHQGTFLRGVRKLPPNRWLSVDAGSARVLRPPRGPRGRPAARERAQTALLPCIQGQVDRLYSLLDCKSPLALALSGGFDSNLVLHRLSSIAPGRLVAFTIGGRAIDETSSTRAITRHYPKSVLVARHLPEEYADILPNIVWRLDGYVVNDAVFLQHALGGAMAEGGHAAAFVSSCADQQLRGPTFHDPLSRVKQSLKQGWAGRAYRKMMCRPTWPDHDVEADNLLKMSGIMLNSFGVHGLYPFLDGSVQRIAASLPRPLRDHKAYYKEQVRRILGPEISRHVARHAGLTDTDYFYHARSARLAALAGSPLAREILRAAMRRTRNGAYLERDWLTLTHICLCQRLFVERTYDDVLSDESFTPRWSDFD